MELYIMQALQLGLSLPCVMQMENVTQHSDVCRDSVEVMPNDCRVVGN